MGTIKSSDRIAVTFYYLVSWFVSGICVNTLHKGDSILPIIIIIIIIIIITISKSFRKYVTTIPGNHAVKELQKTAILGTAHILRKVLM
jgi:hypothetical protein